MFRITRGRVALERLVKAVGDPSSGAVVTFLGTTRNENAGRRVIRLEYEAFTRMADPQGGDGAPHRRRSSR